MEPTELKSRLDAGEPIVLIDVREPQEWEHVRIEGARHLPLREVPVRFTELQPDDFIVVYCHHGMRSASACGFLAQRGFTNVHNLEGGIDAWARQVDPTLRRY